MTVAMNKALPATVRVVEVGPRDGLQNEKELVPLDAKVAFINALSAAGLKHIEVTSFVNPAAVPQMADASVVLARIEKHPGTRYSVLIPNMKGLEARLSVAQELRPEQRSIAIFTAASETFNRANTNAGIVESLKNFARVLERLRTDLPGEMPLIRGYVSTVVRCPYEGPIAPSKVAKIAVHLMELGVDEVSLGDTIGAATPRDIDRLMEAIMAAVSADRIALHLHDTRGIALANVLRAMSYGIHTFDSSAGGLGGCPFAPGAAGNLATEDLLYMLNGMGVETGVDLGAIAAAARFIRPFINHPLPSKELQALESAGF